MVILLKVIIVIPRHPGCQNCIQIHLAPIKQPDNTLRTTFPIHISSSLVIQIHLNTIQEASQHVKE
jgi:hypothetical protein